MFLERHLLWKPKQTSTKYYTDVTRWLYISILALTADVFSGDGSLLLSVSPMKKKLHPWPPYKKKTGVAMYLITL